MHIFYIKTITAIFFLVKKIEKMVMYCNWSL